MRQVLDTLTTKERWSARQISTSWAEAARQTACFEVVITANSSTVLPKARSLRQRQLSLRIPNVRFTLKLLKPVQIAELANLLWQLVSKVSCSAAIFI